MKTYARIRKQYPKANVGKVILGITFKQLMRIRELQAKGLIAQDFNTYRYDEYKAIILDLKAKGLIQ
jgi:hypothetical protein